MSWLSSRPHAASSPSPEARGRLILIAFLDGSHQQVRLDLEIEDLRDTMGPIEIPWREPPGSIVQFALEDQAGASVDDRCTSPALSVCEAGTKEVGHD